MHSSRTITRAFLRFLLRCCAIRRHDREIRVSRCNSEGRRNKAYAVNRHGNVRVVLNYAHRPRGPIKIDSDRPQAFIESARSIFSTTSSFQNGILWRDEVIVNRNCAQCWRATNTIDSYWKEIFETLVNIKQNNNIYYFSYVEIYMEKERFYWSV